MFDAKMRGTTLCKRVVRTEKKIYKYLGRPVEDDAAQNPHHAYRNAELHSQTMNQDGYYALNGRTNDMSVLSIQGNDQRRARTCEDKGPTSKISHRNHENVR